MESPTTRWDSRKWRFGKLQNKVTLPVSDAFQVVDSIFMPHEYLSAEWSFLITDRLERLTVFGKTVCFRKNDEVHFNVFALMGDMKTLGYRIDAAVNRKNRRKVDLLFKNEHDTLIHVHTLRLGILR